MRPSSGFAATILAVCILPNCGRDNGLSSDLTTHLKAHGIIVQPTRIHAPLSSRAGFLVMRHDAGTVAAIVATFRLKQIAPDDRGWAAAAQAVGPSIAAKEIWGASNRPPQFKLKDGGQFEYFYLLVTIDGEMYLFAEYAHG